jgi:hypothetical protein
MARWYATQHLRTDPGIVSIYYLPNGADAREIRLIEINKLIPETNETCLEAIDFGVDTGSENEHKLLVLDVTPAQWDLINQTTPLLHLPQGWTLNEKQLLK